MLTRPPAHRPACGGPCRRGAVSLREKTHAHRHYIDDVPADVKQRRLAEVIATFQRLATEKNAALVGTHQLVLVEGEARRAPGQDLGGRTDANRRVFFPAVPVPTLATGTAAQVPAVGEYVVVVVERTTSQTLRGRAIGRAPTRTAALDALGALASPEPTPLVQAAA